MEIEEKWAFWGFLTRNQGSLISNYFLLPGRLAFTGSLISSLMAIALFAQMIYISIDMRTKIMILELACLLMLGSVLFADREEIINYNWQRFFKEPIEIIYIIMKDGTPFRHTSNSEIAVYTNVRTLRKGIKSLNKSYEIEDIAILIHNHFRDYKFSPDDRKFYKEFKASGFNGLFLLYSHMTNKAYDIEDKEESK